MHYLISDIHGDLPAFQKILNKIHFQPKKDTLIIIGDILDRDAYSLELLSYISQFLKTGSMILLKGNHEMYALRYLSGNLSGTMWDAFGGETTRRQVDVLMPSTQSALRRFLECLPFFLTIDTPAFGKSILVHSGLDQKHLIFQKTDTNTVIDVISSIEAAYHADASHFLTRTDILDLPDTTLEALDHYIIFGHFPTFHLNGGKRSEAFITPYYMDIDCGSGYREDGGWLCCYCIENDEFFYV